MYLFKLLIEQSILSVRRSTLFVAASLLIATLQVGASPLTQREDSSVIMPADVAVSVDDQLAWDFELTYGGNYTLQLVVEPDAAAHTGRARLDGALVGDTLKKTYLIEDGMVSEFEAPLSLSAGHTYTLAIESSLKVVNARLVPVGYTSSRIHLSSEKYYNEWLALHQSPAKVAAMDWYEQARFGMFIHWGVYSEAAGEWKGKKIEEGVGPKVAEWIQYAFQIPRAEYREYAKNFNPDQSFASNIAQLAKDTGMQYVVITAKHHDGFALFDSACSDWDVADATHYDGDLIKELYDACRAEGIDFGVYYSHGHDWGDGADANYANVKAYNDQYGVPTRPNGKNLWDPSPNTYGDYLENKSYAQVKELIELMPDLRLIWFDGEGLITEAEALRFYKMIYDLNPNIVVNRRVGYDFGDYVDAGDNKTPPANELASKHFETCGTANHSWGFKAHDHHWKNSNQLLRNFVDIVSKGGNYLLNIGPDGKGRVPQPCVDSFLEMGEWVQTNREAIFGTTRWTTFSEGVADSSARPSRNPPASKSTEFWFSAKGDKVYAMSLVPAPEMVKILSLNKVAGEVRAVRILGSDQVVGWKQTEEALELTFDESTGGMNGYAVEVAMQQ